LANGRILPQLTCYASDRLAAATAAAASARELPISAYIRLALLDKLKSDGVLLQHKDAAARP
jgi:hypothetical protein